MNSCEMCGVEAKTISHHTKYDISDMKANTIEICRSCHGSIHSKYYNNGVLVETPNNTPIELTCHKCAYHWTYRGLRPDKATCSRCKSSISIKKQTEGGSKKQ